MMWNKFCELGWCSNQVQSNHVFCPYHHDKLSPTQKYPVRNRDFAGPEIIAEMVHFLTREHETLVNCPKCKGRGVNTGHTNYLRGKKCSWCDNGKRPKIS